MHFVSINVYEYYFDESVHSPCCRYHHHKLDNVYFLFYVWLVSDNIIFSGIIQCYEYGCANICQQLYFKFFRMPTRSEIVGLYDTSVLICGGWNYHDIFYSGEYKTGKKIFLKAGSLWDKHWKSIGKKN